MRRDFTNQYGAFTPTENAVIANIDRETAEKRMERKLADRGSAGTNLRTPAKRQTHRQETVEDLMAFFAANPGTKMPQTEQKAKPKDRTAKAHTEPPKPEPQAENEKKARQLFAIFAAMAGFFDASIASMTFRFKGDAYRYDQMNTKNRPVRMEETEK